MSECASCWSLSVCNSSNSNESFKRLSEQQSDSQKKGYIKQVLYQPHNWLRPLLVAVFFLWFSFYHRLNLRTVLNLWFKHKIVTIRMTNSVWTSMKLLYTTKRFSVPEGLQIIKKKVKFSSILKDVSRTRQVANKQDTTFFRFSNKERLKECQCVCRLRDFKMVCEKWASLYDEPDWQKWERELKKEREYYSQSNLLLNKWNKLTALKR